MRKSFRVWVVAAPGHDETMVSEDVTYAQAQHDVEHYMSQGVHSVTVESVWNDAE